MYEEDLSWLHAVNKKWHRSIVTKGQQVPNTGREASSYLWAMEQYRDDDGWLCFVQGDPFDHYPQLLTLLNKVEEYPKQFVPLGNCFVATDGNGLPHHGGLPVKEWFEALIAPWPGDEKGLLFAPGAQFLLHGSMLREKSVDDYRAVREKVDNDPAGAWVMERLWWPWFEWFSLPQESDNE